MLLLLLLRVSEFKLCKHSSALSHIQPGSICELENAR